ncbi:MAG: hypothetical protein K2X66_00285 [Cyanobacteria bacterium]|nr:hypothetical protein [Cyanobacteriota bacterium]
MVQVPGVWQNQNSLSTRSYPNLQPIPFPFPPQQVSQFTQISPIYSPVQPPIPQQPYWAPTPRLYSPIAPQVAHPNPSFNPPSFQPIPQAFTSPAPGQDLNTIHRVTRSPLTEQPLIRLNDTDFTKHQEKQHPGQMGVIANPLPHKAQPLKDLEIWPKTSTWEDEPHLKSKPEKSLEIEENTPHSHQHETQAAPQKGMQRVKSLAIAGGLIATGLLLHRLPKAESKTIHMLSSDWKDWARIVLGIGAVQKINEGMNWKPPAWLSAIEAVAVMNPIANGFNMKSFTQIAVMGPLLAPIVQLSSWINNKGIPKLKENFNIPTWIPRTVMTVGMVFVGFKLYPQVYNRIAESGILGNAAKEEVKSLLKFAKDNNYSRAQVFGSVGMTCYRACCAGSIFCLNEIGEIVGSFINSMKPHPTRKES